MKEVYILAAESARALSQAKIKAAFETDEVQLVFGEDDCLFSVRADDSGQIYAGTANGLFLIAPVITFMTEIRTLLRALSAVSLAASSSGFGSGPRKGSGARR